MIKSRTVYGLIGTVAFYLGLVWLAFLLGWKVALAVYLVTIGMSTEIRLNNHIK